MYGSFEGWVQSNSYPWETYEESRARYESLYGEDEEEFELVDTPAYTYEPKEPEEEQGFLDTLMEGSEWVPSMSELGSAAAKSWYETKASGATIGETIVAPALDWIGDAIDPADIWKKGETLPEQYAEEIREEAPEYREEQLAEAAKYPEVQNRLQKELAKDPNYVPAETREQTLARLKAQGSEWYDIAKHVPEWIPLTLGKAAEDFPTAGEVGSFATGSFVPMAGAAAVGLPTLMLGGGPLLAGGLAMATGGILSSALVSSETADNIKNNPVIRRALNIDDKTPFEKLPPTDQQTLGKVAEDGAQSNLGQRMISSGIPEMLGYIPAGGWLLRAVTDIAGGTASEVWDISVSRESMITALLENGVDESKVAELDAALQAIGPKKSEVFMKALVGEAVASGPIVGAEQIVMSKFPKKMHYVDVSATTTEEIRKQQEKTQEDHIKIRTDQVKSLVDKKAKRQDLVDGIVALHNVDPERATQELEDLKTLDRKVQNDVVDILSAEHPEVLRNISERIGDANRQEELNKVLEKADKTAKQNIEKAEKEAAKEAKAEGDKVAEENKVVDAQKAIDKYESERADMITAKAQERITPEEFDAWDRKNRPVDSYPIVDKYNKSLEAEAKKDAEAEAAEAEVVPEVVEEVVPEPEVVTPEQAKKEEMTAAATALAEKQAKEQSAEAERQAKEDAEKELKGKAKLKAAEAKRKKAKEAKEAEVEVEPVVTEVKGTDLSKKRSLKTLLKKGTSAVLKYVGNKVRVPANLIFTEDIKRGVRLKKLNEAFPNGMTFTDVYKTENALFVKEQGDAVGKAGTKLAAGVGEFQQRAEDNFVNGLIKLQESQTEVVTPEGRVFASKEEQAEYEAMDKKLEKEAEQLKEFEDARDAEKEVDIYDENVRVPAKSLFNRDKDRAESLAEEYPDGMNWDEYRSELGEIKQEQLDDIDSDKDVDMDFGDELDRRADTNFTKAVAKGKKKTPPKVETKAPVKTKAPKAPVKTTTPAKKIVGVNERMDKASDDLKKKNPDATKEEIEAVRKEAMNEYLAGFKPAVKVEAEPVTKVEEEPTPPTMADKEKEYNDFVDKYVKDKADAYSRIRKKDGKGKKQKPTKKLLDQWEEEADGAFLSMQADKISKSIRIFSTLDDTEIDFKGDPEYSLNKDETIKLVEKFKARTKLKGKDVDIVVLSKNDEADQAMLTELLNEKQAEEIFKDAEGFVHTSTGTIYLIAENIQGVVGAKTATGKGTAGSRLVNTLFHEILGHYGLKKLLGDLYNTFINRFIKLNKKMLDKYAVHGAGKNYLPESVRKISDPDERMEAYNKLKEDQKGDKDIADHQRTEFVIAEEYIARNFAEFGARDPNIINRIVASLRNYLSSIPMFEDMGITTNQVKVIMAELQQEYIGGKRNFLFGEDFKTLDTQLDTTEEEDVEAKPEEAPTEDIEGVETLTLTDETEEGKILKSIKQSKALGLYAKYNKDAGVDGTLLLHKNTRPAEGKYRITFLRADGDLDTLRTENGHEHFPTLKKAKDRLEEIAAPASMQDITGGRDVKMSRKPVERDSTIDWVQDREMRGREVAGEDLELELRWLREQEEKGRPQPPPNYKEKINPSRIIKAGSTKIEPVAEGQKRLFNAGTFKRDPEGFIDPHVSDWVIEVAEGAGDVPVGDITKPLVFMSDDQGKWVPSIVSRVLGNKQYPTWDDIREHGRLNIIDLDTDAEVYRLNENYWETENVTDLEGNEFRYYSEMPVGPEPTDWITEEPVEVRYSLTGNDLVDFLKQQGVILRTKEKPVLARDLKQSKKITQPTGEIDSTLDLVQDRGMRGLELDREYLEVELRWLRAQEAKRETEPLTVDDRRSVTDRNVNMSKRTKPDPKKTIKAYKLLQTKKTQTDRLFPLFIGATESIPMGEWHDADIKPRKGFAERPGWHLTDLPFAHHIGTLKDAKSKPTIRPDNQFWTEVEVADDINWQPEADKRAKLYSKGHKLAGQMNPKTADIKNEVPVDGNYRYKTNPNMKGEWIIGGSIKINRILSDSEVMKINRKAGVADLPRKWQKVSLSKKPITFEGELQKAEVEIDSVPFARAAGKRMEEAAKVEARRKTNAERAGAAYRLDISDEAVNKYLKSKADEGHGSLVGAMTLPNMSKIPEKYRGEVAVGMISDRLIRGVYVPFHGKESKHAKNLKLNGGPMYAFDKKRNTGKGGRSAWASQKGPITKIYNAVMGQDIDGNTISNGANYGFIILGNDDMHLSNLDVWAVAYAEALDAVELRGADMALLDQSAITAIANHAPEFKGKIKTFKELMEFGKLNELQAAGKYGNELGFEKRKPILDFIFKQTRAKANNLLSIEELMKRTSAYPDANQGDLVGIIKFHKDKSNFRTTAEDLGIETHPSYKHVLQGEGIYEFKTPIPLNEFAKGWLMEKRRTYTKGKIAAINPPFFKKGQTVFGDDTGLSQAETGVDQLLVEPYTKIGKTYYSNMFYSAELISWITGQPVTSGKFHTDWKADKKKYKAEFKKQKEALTEAEFKEWKKDNKPPKRTIITKKPPRGERYKSRGFKDARKAAVRSVELKAPLITITPDILINPIPAKDITVSMSKKVGAMNAYKAAKVAEGRLTDEGLYWIPTFRWQDKLSNKLTRRLVAQGTLPDVELFKDIRKKNKGIVFQAQQAGEKLFAILSKSKQQKVLYDYFVTPNANASTITNKKERQAAKDAKAQIQLIGRDLVEAGLMTQKSLDKFDDQYLPRKYLKYLLRDKDFRAIDQGGAGVNVDLGYVEKRKDIPKGIRELIMGEVKDPAFLSSIAISTPIRDLAILDMFEQIATEGLNKKRGWVLPSTLVKFDILGEMKRLTNNDTALIEDLQLMDTEGVLISGHWLLNEAERLRDRVDNHMMLEPAKEKLVRKLINVMTTKGNEITKNVILPKNYRRVPKGRKYGRLSGMAIRKEIFEDLFGWGSKGNTFDINDDGTIDASWAERVLGTGGTFEQYNRIWKWSKVSANPPSWVRNFISNLIFMSLGPVPLPRMPDLFLAALADQIKTRYVQEFGTQKEFDALETHTKIADEMGLTSGGFSQAELKTIRNNFVASKNKAGGSLGLLRIRDSFKGGLSAFQRGTSDLYGGIDTLGKVMMVKYLMKSKKASKEVAAAQAEKFLFDYSNPLPSVKYLRKTAFGAPFISYPSFVAPILIETIIKRPWKFAPFILLAEYMKQSFKEEQDISDEEYEAVMGTLSEYLRKRANVSGKGMFFDFSLIPESVLPLPNKDALGRAAVGDVGYFYPWGMFTEVFRLLNPFKDEGSEISKAMHTVGLMGAPLLNMAVTSLTGRDPFTDKQIHDELATPAQKYAGWFNYMFNLTLPPMFHGISPIGGAYSPIGANPNAGGFGAVTRLYEAYSNTVGREGEPKFTKAQAWARMFGLNITPIAPFEARAKQVYFEVQKIKKLKRGISQKVEKALRAHYTKEEIEGIVKYEVGIINRLIEKLNKKVSKKLPASLKRSKMELMRSREKYLKYLKTMKAG